MVSSLLLYHITWSSSGIRKKKVSRGVIEGCLGNIKAIAFSPDGQLLATASGDTVELWGPEKIASRGVIKGQLGNIKAIAFSPGDQLLATASDNEIMLWDPAEAALLGILKSQSGQVEAMEFCPDGHLLVIARDVRSPKQEIQELQPSHAQSKVCIFRHILARKAILWCCVEGSIESISLSPDARYLMLNRDAVDTSLANTPRTPSDSLHLYAKEHWVIWKNERVLWLPPEYRTACTSVHGNVLALGDSSGQVFFLNFGSKPSDDESDGNDGDASSLASTASVD
jgi:WD40 repeat protein